QVRVAAVGIRGPEHVGFALRPLAPGTLDPEPELRTDVAEQPHLRAGTRQLFGASSNGLADLDRQFLRVRERGVREAGQRRQQTAAPHGNRTSSARSSTTTWPSVTSWPGRHARNV